MPETTTIHHVFEHPWEHISLAYWLKYPSPLRPDVLSVDLLEREFDPETGVLRAKRIVTSRMSLPSWLRAVLPWDASLDCHGLEEAVIDPRKQEMTLTAQTITFSNLIRVTERCTYAVDLENNEWTMLKQEAETTSDAFWGVRAKIEQWSLEQFKAKAELGRQIMEESTQRAIADLTSYGRIIINEAQATSL